MEDACIDSLHLSFPPGQCETSVSVWLRQDLVLEGSERLLLYLTNCSNCVSNVSLAQPMEIVIDDTRDCELHTHHSLPEREGHCCKKKLHFCVGLSGAIATKDYPNNVEEPLRYKVALLCRNHSDFLRALKAC